LGVLNYDKKLNLFMIDSNERMKQLIGKQDIRGEKL
jgi:hypothetical protein